MIKGQRTIQRPPTRRVWRRIYLREWREHREHSVEDLAELADVSPALISLIENKKSAGSPESLEKLADALKIGIGELFNPPPETGSVLIRTWVKKEDRERLERLIKAWEGDTITKS